MSSSSRPVVNISRQAVKTATISHARFNGKMAHYLHWTVNHAFLLDEITGYCLIVGAIERLQSQTPQQDKSAS